MLFKQEGFVNILFEVIILPTGKLGPEIIFDAAYLPVDIVGSAFMFFGFDFKFLKFFDIGSSACANYALKILDIAIDDSL